MAESKMPGLTSRLSGFNPFSRPKRLDEKDDMGEEVTSASVGGGGHGARQTGVTQHQLRISYTLRSFLVEENFLTPEAAGSEESDQPTVELQAILDKPHIHVPAALTDRSHPLPEYFISSSHNTYLVSHQLVGTSAAEAYDVALSSGSRCVEIDAWDNDEDKYEPKVTHGYTLVSHIKFRSVCEAIRDSFDKEAAESSQEEGYRTAPILLSLENHCGANGQLRLVQIMKEVWGDRLLSEAVRQEGHEEQDGGSKHVCLSELGSKIVVIVEHHIAGEVEPDDDDSGDDEETAAQGSKEYKEKKKKAATTLIIPELADLGVYAQSVKPSDNSWFEQLKITNGPHHHLINVSESGLGSHMPAANDKISRHNALHLMRVFPKGTRISSQNLNPVPFWGIGAQICALNWQTFGASMQLNEALFSGTDGYVLKPDALRPGGSGKLSTGRQMRLRLHIAGASSVPIPDTHEPDEIKPYTTCVLIHPDNLKNSPPKRKTAAYKPHKLSMLHRGPNPPAADPFWNETLEWEYEENELVFLRMLIKSDDSFASNPILTVAAVRLLYTSPGWTFVRMLDLKGRETTCTLLVRFEISPLDG